MTDSTGPLDELRDNLTGSAAGDYAPRIDGDSVADTEVPSEADVSPLDRPADEEKVAVRDEDSDGAPEL